MIKTLLAWPRLLKQLVVILADTLISLFTVWLAFSLRLGEWHQPLRSEIGAYLGAIILILPIFIRLGLYRAIFRYSGYHALWQIVQAVTLYLPCYLILVIYLHNLGYGIPRTLGVIQPLLLLFFVGGMRAGARFLLNGYLFTSNSRQTNVLIYGAGDAGVQLAQSLSGRTGFKLCGYIDDRREQQGHSINGTMVYAPEKIESLILRHQITDILLALPSASRKQRQLILENLRHYPVHVRSLPRLTDLVEGKVDIQAVRELDVEDLLGREPVQLDIALWEQQITGKVILITGAGGSIGSELCRQVLTVAPATLLLLDHSEYALYSIHAELAKRVSALSSATKIVPLLASVKDYSTIYKIIQTWRPSWIYHAAAYKHVPMVEHNPIEGIVNNTLATLNLACAAMACQIPYMVLVSTDKAVRPTNVMGASKRLAEMILQALAHEPNPHIPSDILAISADMPKPCVSGRKTCFSVVRFGNVLDSSGSVVPLFRQQIAQGGPVTITDAEVTRYFMTIPEAAQLVIQAGMVAHEGDVFVLDMGQPVKVLELAQRMIELSGLRVQDKAHPEGDIAIQFIGLRPGEKLYEELLIGNNPQPTQHARILRAQETYIPWVQLCQGLQIIQRAMAEHDVHTLSQQLTQLVEGYIPFAVVDWLTCARNEAAGA
jgi:FlaA1/EpsC-like NDP-sugar epimerase